MVVSWFWNYEAIKGCTTRASLFFLYAPQKTGSRSGRKAKMFAEKGVLEIIGHLEARARRVR